MWDRVVLLLDLGADCYVECACYYRLCCCWTLVSAVKLKVHATPHRLCARVFVRIYDMALVRAEGRKCGAIGLYCILCSWTSALVATLQPK